MSDTGFKAPTYEEWYNRSVNKINQDTQAAKDLANINYQKSKSEYGSNAAALESMGLTGSGYSNYLNSQAYAQRQSAYANADAQRAQSMFDLDTKYMDILESQKKADEEKQAALDANFLSTLGSITADTTDDEINSLATIMGYSPEQITTLTNQRNSKITARNESEAKAATEKQKTAYQTILGIINYATSDDMIDTLAAAYGLTDATYIKNLKDARVSMANDYMRSLDPDSDEFSVQMLDYLFPNRTYAEGAEEPAASKYYTNYYNQIVDGANDLVYPGMFAGTDEATESVTYKDTKDLLTQLKNEADDETVKQKLEASLTTLDEEYNKAYSGKDDEPGGTPNGVKYNINDGLTVTSLPNKKENYGEKGKDVILKSGSTVYKVQFSGNESEEARHAAQNAGLGEKKIFTYNGKLYILLENDDPNYEYDTDYTDDVHAKTEAGKHLFAYELTPRWGLGNRQDNFYNDLVKLVEGTQD